MPTSYAGNLSSTKRFSIVTETYPPEINGVANSLQQLATGLHRKGHHVQIIRPRQHAQDTNGMRESGLEHVTMPGLPLPGYLDLKFGVPLTQTFSTVWRPAALNAASYIRPSFGRPRPAFAAYDAAIKPPASSEPTNQSFAFTISPKLKNARCERAITRQLSRRVAIGSSCSLCDGAGHRSRVVASHFAAVVRLFCGR